jgi:hypothetical protein
MFFHSVHVMQMRSPNTWPQWYRSGKSCYVYLHVSSQELEKYHALHRENSCITYGILFSNLLHVSFTNFILHSCDFSGTWERNVSSRRWDSADRLLFTQMQQCYPNVLTSVLLYSWPSSDTSISHLKSMLIKIK